MKQFQSFVVACIALTIFSGCKKNVDSGFTNQSAESASAEQLSSLAASTIAAPGAMQYGALIGTPDTTTDVCGFRTTVAQRLGITCIRDQVAIEAPKPVKLLTSGYRILLNFNSSGQMPRPFQTDLNTYKKNLRKVLSSFTVMPEIAVIENEESNMKYFSGSATEYINQLKAAISVFHSYGIKVANGGITYVGLSYLVYQDYLARGMTAEAEDYRQRMHIALKSEMTLDRADFIKTLLNSYAKIDLDYVNFHWYSKKPEDAQAFGEDIDYLQRVTGKTAITNELGQYDEISETMNNTLQQAVNYRLPYVVWFSGMMSDRSTPLHNSDRSLTYTGNAYKNFIRNNK